MKKNQVLPNSTILASAMICGSRVSHSGIQLTEISSLENSSLPIYRVHIWVENNFVFSMFDDNHIRLEADLYNLLSDARSIFEKHKEAENSHTCRFKEE
jgi:hypothetical protein